MKYIDNFLNGITMYKLVMYGLLSLAGASLFFSALGLLSYSPLGLLITLIYIVLVCFVSNTIFAKILNVQVNSESYLITSLILFFILFPITSVNDLVTVGMVAFVAMASKYILAINKKHIFNPVAIAIFLATISGSGVASWWVGSVYLIVPVVIIGFLVLRKVRRFELFSAYILTSVVSLFLFSYLNHFNYFETLKITFLSGPILFLGFFMLTEPLTTPPKKKMQIIYGAIVGVLLGSSFEYGILYSTPGLALVIGNIFSYIVSPKAKLVLTLIKKNQLTKDIYEFFFKSEERLDYKPGQYLEWTLGHKSPDIRGNRRYFTIASSPTEEEIKLGVKFYDNSSSFKKKLMGMNEGETIVASQLSGEFILPVDTNKKLVFIAGGIGVTPFRSMVKYLVDKKEKRDVVLFFSNRTPADIVYKDLFDQAEREIGLKTIYAVNDLAGASLDNNMRVGFVTEEMIKKEVPDYADRIFYISGPHVMITAFESTLSKMGVKASNIKTDFFPGFV
jgi:ferredoxin-NADP reductase/Na+-translocating ferredoxin:NAD+ oxidoreductase RnfD subunit